MRLARRLDTIVLRGSHSLSHGGSMAARRKGAARAQFKLVSPDIRPNGPIAMEQVFNGFGCSGENVSPALEWSGAPEATKSLALLVHDPDAPTGGAGWWHWVVLNIPADTKALPAGGQGRRQGVAEGRGPGQHRLRQPRLRRTVSAARQRQPSLQLHALRAQGRQ